ncbi:MAG: hypothetical protein HXS46_19465 [Theionarchaea archaeon]|nr:hypothetical protein [Theionarchaea archaeon]
MKSRYFIPWIFIFFLLSGYIITGYTRHYLYDKMIEEYIAEQMSSRDQGLPKPMGWETHDYLGSPEAALVVVDPAFQEEIYSLCDVWLVYSTEYETDVLLLLLEGVNDDRWCLWDAYKRITIFEYLRTVLTVASNAGVIQITPHSDEDWGGSLAESIALWEAAGGERKGNWIKTYKHSSEYEGWLDQILEEIANPEGSDSPSITDHFVETTRQVELSYCSFFLQEDKLETQRKMTEIAYKRYVTHVAEKDVVPASIDSWVVRFGASNFSDTATRNYSLPYILGMEGFPLRDLVVDFLVIVGFSFGFTYFVVKRKLAKHK